MTTRQAERKTSVVALFGQLGQSLARYLILTRRGDGPRGLCTLVLRSDTYVYYLVSTDRYFTLLVYQFAHMGRVLKSLEDLVVADIGHIAAPLQPPVPVVLSQESSAPQPIPIPIVSAQAFPAAKAAPEPQPPKSKRTPPLPALAPLAAPAPFVPPPPPVASIEASEWFEAAALPESSEKPNSESSQSPSAKTAPMPEADSVATDVVTIVAAAEAPIAPAIMPAEAPATQAALPIATPSSAETPTQQPAPLMLAEKAPLAPPALTEAPPPPAAADLRTDVETPIAAPQPPPIAPEKAEPAQIAETSAKLADVAAPATIAADADAQTPAPKIELAAPPDTPEGIATPPAAPATTATPVASAAVLPDFKDAVLILRGFTATVEERTILKDLNLRIGRRGVFALMGPGASGKSSLLGVLSGRNGAASGWTFGGEVIYGGVSLGAAARPAVVGQKVARPAVSLRSYLLEYQDDGAGEGGDESIIEILQACQLSRLSSSLDEILGGPSLKLSSGEWWRLAIARELFGNPALLCVDEPKRKSAPSCSSAISSNMPARAAIT
jgi:ABC-type phosphate transport system ATPase subunit